MDFSRLPDGVLLNIFEYLPMEDCSQLGRVNNQFHRMSQLVISRTKFLDLANHRFRKLNADQLAVILNLCSPNLEKIEFPFGDQRGVQVPLVAKLANYECSRMTVINLWNIPIDYAVFEQLIRNNSSLKCLSWYARFVGFPDVTSINLKELYLNSVNDVTLQSMNGRIPNLEELGLKNTNVTANVLDEFFASSQRIQRVTLYFVPPANHIVFDDSLVHFWNLPLTSLAIKLNCKVVLSLVATSFPHLQKLWIPVSKPSSQDISALAALQDLEILKLDIANATDHNDDDGFRALVACKQLRSLEVSPLSISSGALIALLRGCPQLNFVRISKINGVHTPDEAAVILGSLSGIAKRDIIIGFNTISGDMNAWLQSIWKSKAAEEAITSLERNEGFKVCINGLYLF